MTRIEYHPSARKEIAQAQAWYAAQSPSSSARLATFIDQAIQKIATDPERFFRIDTKHQACSVEKFPYQIIFRHEADRIYIVAVAHAKRRPGYWRRRK